MSITEGRGVKTVDGVLHLSEGGLLFPHLERATLTLVLPSSLYLVAEILTCSRILLALWKAGSMRSTTRPLARNDVLRMSVAEVAEDSIDHTDEVCVLLGDPTGAGRDGSVEEDGQLDLGVQSLL